MTLEQLLNCSAADLEKLSDLELERELAPFFDVTRPERIVGMKKSTIPSLGKTPSPIPLAQLRQMAEKHGLSELFKDVFD